jgi:hypothetical protein
MQIKSKDNSFEKVSAEKIEMRTNEKRSNGGIYA